MLTEDEIRENLKEVEGRIAEAAGKAGRERGEIKLIAVSKTNPVEVLEAAYDCGVRVFGENRVQELKDKIDYFESKGIKDIEWHLIGHLQTNKVKYIIGRVAMIHSVDSLKLAKAINDESERKGIITDVLIEINVGDEESKFGLSLENTPEFADELASFKNIRVKGLMCVAPFTENSEDNRKYFSKMRKLSVDIREKNKDNSSMCELSMGMTGDYSVAIEEGATMVRVGTGIFGKRNYTIS